MTLVRELLAELVGMFAGDARLSIAILLVVGLAAALIDLANVAALAGGGVLVVGCLLILFENVRRTGRGNPTR